MENWRLLHDAQMCGLFCRRTGTLKHLKRMAGINYNDALKVNLAREVPVVIRNRSGT